MIPQEYIQELVQRSDIVSVVQNYVQLRHRGRTHMGLCPFHSEKTPSFVVYPESDSFYCFGCQSGGSAIHFIQKIENIGYVEAIKLLAERVGMPLFDEEDDGLKLRSRVLAINKAVARFYFKSMNEEGGKEARLYWRSRGLTDDTIRRFGLGFAPDSFNATRDYLKAQGFKEDELLSAGIIRKNEKGNVYDFFRGRAMIPIFDIRGNVIAFSGRILNSEQKGGKYVNSPETLVYKKSRVLFALNLAKKESVKRYILCEGNLDAISLHQAGFKTAIAGCGTALTPEQVKVLEDYADEVVLCYDTDEAGQKATQKALRLFDNSPIKVTVLQMQGAKDPDEYLQKFGADSFNMLLDGAHNAIEHALLQCKNKFNLAIDDNRVAYLKEAANLLAGKLTQIERDVYAGRLAEETNVSKTAVLAQIESAQKNKARYNKRQQERNLYKEGAGFNISVPYSKGGQKALGVAFSEQQLIAAIMRNSDYLKLAKQKLTPQQFIDEKMSKIYELMLLHGEGYFDLASFGQELPPDTIQILSRIMAQNYETSLSEDDVNQYINRILQSVPMSVSAGEKPKEELNDYIKKLAENKK